MKLIKALLIVALFALPACPAGCPTPPPPSAWIDCSKDAVKNRAIGLIPKVNDCLTTLSFESCLLSLIQPAIGITEDVLACVVQYRQNGFAASATANPNDQVSRDAARHAGEFIAKRGYTFEPPPETGSGLGGESAQ